MLLIITLFSDTILDLGRESHCTNSIIRVTGSAAKRIIAKNFLWVSVRGNERLPHVQCVLSSSRTYSPSKCFDSRNKQHFEPYLEKVPPLKELPYEEVLGRQPVLWRRPTLVRMWFQNWLLRRFSLTNLRHQRNLLEAYYMGCEMFKMAFRTITLSSFSQESAISMQSRGYFIYCSHNARVSKILAVTCFYKSNFRNSFIYHIRMWSLRGRTHFIQIDFQIILSHLLMWMSMSTTRYAHICKLFYL